jgi:hypothetical protein
MIKRSASLFRAPHWLGAIAQLGERVLCKHEVVGSIPTGSTSRTLLRKVFCIQLQTKRAVHEIPNSNSPRLALRCRRVV